MRGVQEISCRFPKASNARLMIYDSCKYEQSSRKIDEIEYMVTGCCIKGEDVVKDGDGSCVDPYGEYLVLYLEGGKTATFRNSFVDLFFY